MGSGVQHGAVTFLVDDEASIEGACTIEALGEYIRRVDDSIDSAYARLEHARGERSVVVLVNVDGRVSSWLLPRSGAPVASAEAVCVVEAVMQTEPIEVRRPIGFAMHFAVGGAPLRVKVLDTVPEEWQTVMATAAQPPASMAEFFGLFWSSHV